MKGFSTIEIIIALALMVTIIVGAVDANISAEYWAFTTQIATEALYKAKTQIEITRARSEVDFQSASSTIPVKLNEFGDVADIDCTQGSLCYFAGNTVIDISSCSKYVENNISWRINERYPTTSTMLATYLINNDEMVAKGGDCLVTEPQGNWLQGVPSVVGLQVVQPLFSSAVDVFEDKVYVTSSSSPQLRIYSTPQSPGQNPVLVGSSTVYGKRINALDVSEDMYTRRTYAYVVQHASTSQLAIIDVTDPAHVIPLLQKTLFGVSSSASFPQGWRVFVYGNRLYVTTRETAGPELHVFDITVPSLAYEITNALVGLNRTVNDFVVREQFYEGGIHRYLFLATSAALRELSIYDVTSDVPVEVQSYDLSGTADASSLFLNGNKLYLGRKSSSGPELFVFDVRSLISGNGTPIASSEIGADVHTLKGSGSVLYMGTSKSGAEFQVWNTDTAFWNPLVVNTGRVSFLNIPHVAPLGIDIGSNYIYLQSQSATQPEQVTVLYMP